MSQTAAQLGRPLEILLVEDSPSDALLTQAALDREIDNLLHHVQDGQQALAYLRQEGEFQAATRPDLVLMDLNMPRMNGLEALQEIRSDPMLEALPVIVLTTSDDDRDVNAAYKLHANCFLTKPGEMADLYEAISCFKNFWVRFVRLPANPH